MQIAFLNYHRVFLFSILVYSIYSFPGCITAINAQDINPSAKKKSDFVSQEEKEFIKIKQLKVKTRSKYALTNDESNQTSTKKILLTTENFNRKGLLTEMTEQNSRGDVISYYSFTYDSKGRHIKGEGEENRGKSSTQTSKYDSKGNEIERRLVSIGRKRIESKAVMKYDKNGNVIEIKNYENDKLQEQQQIKYENNVRISTIFFDKNGDTVMVSTPEYNSAGKLLKEERKDPNGGVITYTYKYDDAGYLSEMTDFETKRNYTSDEKGNVVEYKMYLLDGRRQIRLVFKYNSKGLQSEQIRYDNNETVVLHMVYEYEYYK